MCARPTACGHGVRACYGVRAVALRSASAARLLVLGAAAIAAAVGALAACCTLRVQADRLRSPYLLTNMGVMSGIVQAYMLVMMMMMAAGTRRTRAAAAAAESKASDDGTPDAKRPKPDQEELLTAPKPDLVQVETHKLAWKNELEIGTVLQLPGGKVYKKTSAKKISRCLGNSTAEFHRNLDIQFTEQIRGDKAKRDAQLAEFVAEDAARAHIYHDLVSKAKVPEEEGPEREAWIRTYWHLCYCWGETLRTLTPSSAQTFCNEIAEIFKPVGTEVTIFPYVAAVLVNTRRVHITIDTGLHPKHRTPEIVKAAIQKHPDAKGLEVSFTCSRLLKARNLDLIIIDTFTFGGHTFPGKVYHAEDAYSQFDAHDETNQLAEAARLAAGATASVTPQTDYRDFFQRMASQLRQLGIRPDKNKMLMGARQSVAFQHMFDGLQKLIDAGNLTQDTAVDLFLSTPTAPVTATVILNENGTELMSGIIGLLLRTGAGPLDYITVATNQLCVWR